MGATSVLAKPKLHDFQRKIEVCHLPGGGVKRVGGPHCLRAGSTTTVSGKRCFSRLELFSVPQQAGTHIEILLESREAI
jgi:hypothetical protein